jgi:type VI protein secretion system component Hcp
MRKFAVLTLITLLAMAVTPGSADAKPAAKKTSKGTQQQYLQYQLKDVTISSFRSGQSTPSSSGRPSGGSRSAR